MSPKKPLILVSNDDGFFSPGIRALAEVAEEFGEVVLVAPDRQQSAVGHAITMSNPLRVNEIIVAKKYRAFTVNGTPADCIKLAHGNLLERKPDLILSGINHGSNAGINVLYSGTVSAATEGTILGYPSIAVSCTEFDEKADLSGAQEAARKVAAYVFSKGLKRGVTLNVNAPMGRFKGIEWSRMADSRYVEQYENRLDPNNRAYYWLTGKFELLDKNDNADIKVLNSGKATVTPIQYDMTDYTLLKNSSDDDF